LSHQASYLHLFTNGELARRVEKAYEKLSGCDLCAHTCRANRLGGRTGVCGADDLARVSSYGPHFGEEDVLVGRGGSGTIFFSGCNLQCIFCQNWDISQNGEGEEFTAGELAGIMVKLQERGCHNINLVTPTPYLPSILAALNIAAAHGLDLPLVYNCGGYESLTALKLLDGVVDIYMPDVKFADDETGRRLSGAKNYFTAVKIALKEMHRQVGNLQLDERGMAYHGLIVRHLVLPGDLAGTETVVNFISGEISRNTYINVMAQYYPTFRSEDFPPLNRRLSSGEYEAAVKVARAAGLHRFAKG
jgi:putative pyruvate formate lyase activating enzyme